MPSASFPPAAQPDLVRAAQKDAFYLAMLREQVSELARALLGARRAVGLQREAGLLASLLYFGLTTGCGLPTLGEEYCDLALVEGPAQRPLGRSRRAALVAAHTLLPYALAREVRAAAAAVAADDGEASAVTTREDASFASPSAALRSLVQRLRAALRVVLSNAGEPLALASRVHTALFYLGGLYLSPAYRLVGARRVFVGAQNVPRASYAALGVLLLLQCAVAGAGMARRAAGEAAAAARRARDARKGVTAGGVAAATHGGAHSDAPQGRHASLVVSAAGSDTGDASGGDGIVARNMEVSFPLDPPLPGGPFSAFWSPPPAPGAPRCSLCLAPRRAPAATPCGHVFCWACVVGWTATKPACPLCRAPCAPQECAPIYNMA